MLHFGHNYHVLVVRVLDARPVVGFPVERIKILPDNENADVECEQNEDNHEQFVVLDHFLVQLDVGKDGVDSKGFAEHRAEGQGETGHQNPGARVADVGKIVLAREARVEAENDHTGEGEDAADDDEIVQVGTGHLDVSACVRAGDQLTG